MAEIIKVDGTRQELKDTSLKSLQKAVGGYIQIITLHTKPAQLMVMDEEGKLKDKPLNKEATRIARPYLFSGDYIAGDAVLAAENEIQ